MKKALEWALAGEATDPKAPYFVVWEARVRLKMGDKAGAIKAAERGVQLGATVHGNTLDNLLTFPRLRKLIERGEVATHGAYFGVATGRLTVLDKQTGEFKPVVR